MKLKDFRTSRKIKQAEIAKICDVTQNTVSGWEHGISAMSLRHAIKIAQYYNVELSEVFDIGDMFTIPQDKVRETPTGDIDILGSIGNQIEKSLKQLDEQPQQKALELLSQGTERFKKATELLPLLLDLNDEQYNAMFALLKTMKKES